MRDAWRLAVGTLTAIPVRPPEVVDRRTAGRAMALAPLAAVPLGIVAALIVALGHLTQMPPLVVAVLAIGAVALGNRAFHLDGLSDVVDGMAASFDRERSLQVMKNGTSGPAGVVAIVLVLGLQVAALASLLTVEEWGWVAVVVGAAVCGSRAALPLGCMVGFEPARPDGLGRLFTQTVPRWRVALIWTALAVVLALLGEAAGLGWWRGPVAALAAVVSVVVLIARARARFGGVTGDVFGAGVEVALAGLLVSLA